MKSLKELLYESLNEDCENCGVGIFKKEDEAEEQERVKAIHCGCEDEAEEQEKADESIKSEEDFKDYAKNKFEIVFGDKLDEDKMNKTIEGILNDNKEMVENNEWGKIVGILNKSFGA